MTRGDPDTIAAIATPAGTGGIGIVRVSGPRVPEIARALIGRLPTARRASVTIFRDADGGPIDQGLVIYFPYPDSFTGEHVLELHGHGGPVVLDLLIQRLLAAGARLAQPGEFSERAFLNGKLDLAQAEAVADLIGAASSAAARAALHSLSGAFSTRIQSIADQLVELRTRIEASLDFPEEEIDLPTENMLVIRAETIQQALVDLRADSRQGQLLRDGITVALAGKPNAGKSSLLNLLARRDAAIVSATPGTTRDVLREPIQIDGLPLHVVDTAGLRDTSDDIEAEGVRRARQAIESADRVLLLVDDAAESEAKIRALLETLPRQNAPPVTLVRNKIDLSGRDAGHQDSGPQGVPEVSLCARDGRGLDALHAHLKNCMGYRPAGEGAFSARRRHLEALARCDRHLATVPDELRARRLELAAEGLRQAQQALAEITGEVTSDDLLGKIFATFCIGK